MAECSDNSGALIAGWVIAGVLVLVTIVYLINSRFGCMPHWISRIISDKEFLKEYERRLDNVIEHDLRKRFKFGKKLGEGVTAAVFRITEKATGQHFALKKINLKGSASLTRAVERELKILKKLRHHHVTVLHDAFQTPLRVWAILEFVSGGELTHYISMTDHAWDESMASRCIYQVLSGVAYLHGQGVCHRDIKLANLLRSSRGSNFQMKIADFGAACVFTVPDDAATISQSHPSADEASPDRHAAAAGHEAFKRIDSGRECIGTPCNMAPEIFARRYGPMADLWSLGCVVYELLVGEPPFDPYKLPADDPEYHLKRNVKDGRYPTTALQAWRELSAYGKDLISKLLCTSATSRLSAWEALQHPFMRLRYTTDKSKASSLDLMRKNMRERRKSHLSKTRLAESNASGTSAAAVSDGTQTATRADNGGLLTDAAAAEAALPAAMQPRREKSVIHDLLAAGVLDTEDDIPEDVKKARHTGIAAFEVEDGYDEESSRTARASRAASTDAEQVQVEVKH